MTRGLVIGKFLPPHEGHHHLINVAQRNCDNLEIIVCYTDEDEINYIRRGYWLTNRHQFARITYLHYSSEEDNGDSKYWAEKTYKHLGYYPDIVFTSEDYGDAYAQFMGAKHMPVDKDRILYPVSGTAIRNNPYANWDFMDEQLRAYYGLRVIIIGAESTGKTTLARDLAVEYNTVWTPEFGRMYADAKTNGIWKADDFDHIVFMQDLFENQMAKLANRILFCDTDSVSTYFWENALTGTNERKFNNSNIRSQSNNRIYILAGIDVPFEQDGTRDLWRRKEMHNQFLDELGDMDITYSTVHGNRQERVHQVKLIINALEPKIEG